MNRWKMVGLVMLLGIILFWGSRVLFEEDMVGIAWEDEVLVTEMRGESNVDLYLCVTEPSVSLEKDAQEALVHQEEVFELQEIALPTLPQIIVREEVVVEQAQTIPEPTKNVEPVETYEDEAVQKQMRQAFDELLRVPEDAFRLIPEGTRLNNLLVINGELILDFSEEMLRYGGNAWEEALVNQLLEVAFANPEICNITITFDREIENFVEGTTINRYTRENWNERKRSDEE